MDKKPDFYTVILEKHYGDKSEREVVISKFKNFFIAGFDEKGVLKTVYDGISPMAGAFLSEIVNQELCIHPINTEKALKIAQAMRDRKIVLPKVNEEVPVDLKNVKK